MGNVADRAPDPGDGCRMVCERAIIQLISAQPFFCFVPPLILEKEGFFGFFFSRGASARDFRIE